MDTEIFIPFIFFSFLAAIILGPIMLKERTKRSAYRLISQAMDRGQQLDAALINDLAQVSDQPTARKSLGKGVILLALAGALVGLAFMRGIEAGDDALAGALILGALGGAFALLAAIDYLTQKRT